MRAHWSMKVEAKVASDESTPLHLWKSLSEVEFYKKLSVVDLEGEEVGDKES